MSKHTQSPSPRVWQESSAASLCGLGVSLRRGGVLAALEAGCTIRQKTLRYTPGQKLTMLFAGLLSGSTSVSSLEYRLRADPALQTAFGLPGCAEQSVIADTLDAATAADVAALRGATEALLRQYSRALQHDLQSGIVTLDLDLSPAPTAMRAEGVERGYQGGQKRKGRKLIRVRAAQAGETLYEDVLAGNRVEHLPLVEQAVGAIERLFGMAGDSPEARAKRAHLEWRLDSGWGSDPILRWLLERGYQVTGKFRAHRRVSRLVQSITDWQPTHRADTSWALVPEPVPFSRPLLQVAVRTPATKRPDGYAYSVFFATRTRLGALGLIQHYDARSGMEADLKSDKRGLALTVIRKHQLPAQQVVVLLTDLAHNVLTWTRAWLAACAPRFGGYGVVRQIQQLWAIPGRVKVVQGTLIRIRLREVHPLTPLLAPLLLTLLHDHSPPFLGQT